MNFSLTSCYGCQWVSMNTDNMIPVPVSLDKYDICVRPVPSWVSITWISVGVEVFMGTHEFLNYLVFGTKNNFFLITKKKNQLLNIPT